MQHDDGTSDSLIERSRDDPSVFVEMLERHRGYLRVVAQRQIGSRLGQRLDASDVVQQTWLEAHRDFEHFSGRSEAEFVAWLRRILDRNVSEVIRNHTKVAKRAVNREQSLDQNATLPRDGNQPAVQSSPSQRAMRGESAVQLASALESLPDDQREAVRLRHLEGWPLARIAEQLDRTPAAAASLIKRGLANLRAKLPPRGS